MLSELNEQLSQQADYCSSLGAATCTLLWRVSQREECIHSILSGVRLLDCVYCEMFKINTVRQEKLCVAGGNLVPRPLPAFQHLMRKVGGLGRK